MQHKNADISYRVPLAFITFLLYLFSFSPSASWAGPPFVSDDPAPVEYHHEEFYASSRYADNKGEQEGTLPHFEFDYGVLPDVPITSPCPNRFYPSEIQRDITKAITLGAEIFYFGRHIADGLDRIGYDVGGIFNISEEHHVLFPEGVTSGETIGYLSISATNWPTDELG